MGEYPTMIVLAPNGPQGGKLKLKVEGPEQHQRFAQAVRDLGEQSTFQQVAQVAQTEGLTRVDK